MSRLQVHVDGLRDMGHRFVDAWHRAEQGERFAETHVTFLDLESMQATLSPRRLELLRHLRQHGAESMRALASALGRDYKNVHQDVAVEEGSGLAFASLIHSRHGPTRGSGSRPAFAS